MVQILIQGACLSMREPEPGKKLYVDISFMGGKINVQIPDHLISSLRSRIGHECVFLVDSYQRTYYRTSKDGASHLDVTFSPGKVLEIKDKK